MRDYVSDVASHPGGPLSPVCQSPPPAKLEKLQSKFSVYTPGTPRNSLLCDYPNYDPHNPFPLTEMYPMPCAKGAGVGYDDPKVINISFNEEVLISDNQEDT